jgi:hypothetical protein
MALVASVQSSLAFGVALSGRIWERGAVADAGDTKKPMTLGFCTT